MIFLKMRFVIFEKVLSVTLFWLFKSVRRLAWKFKHFRAKLRPGLAIGATSHGLYATVMVTG